MFDLKVETSHVCFKRTENTSVPWHANAEAARGKLRDLVPATSLLEMDDFEFPVVLRLKRPAADVTVFKMSPRLKQLAEQCSGGATGTNT
jgi:hypothetical protein